MECGHEHNFSENIKAVKMFSKDFVFNIQF